jgi:hypothetical protein
VARLDRGAVDRMVGPQWIGSADPKLKDSGTPPTPRRGFDYNPVGVSGIVEISTRFV